MNLGHNQFERSHTKPCVHAKTYKMHEYRKKDSLKHTGRQI